MCTFCENVLFSCLIVLFLIFGYPFSGYDDFYEFMVL